MLGNPLQSHSSRNIFPLPAMESIKIEIFQNEKTDKSSHKFRGFFGQDSTNTCIFKKRLKYARKKQNI